MYCLEVITCPTYQKPRIIRDNFNRDSSFCESPNGTVIHSAVHRSTCFLYKEDSSYAVFQYWKEQGQASINAYIVAAVNECSENSRELAAISAKHPSLVFKRFSCCGKLLCTATDGKALETRVSGTDWRELNDKLSPKVKGYAIKTIKGYLATQGRTSWLQDTPDGWALHSTEQGAIDSISDTLETGDIVPVY